MKNIIYLILFIIGMILTSATAATIITVKPVTPKQVDPRWFSGERRIDGFIKAKLKQGYVVKTMTMSQYSCYVVMEKH